MTEYRRRPRPVAPQPFDPRPSIRVGLDLLRAAGVPHALAGRLAVWTWVPDGERELTKDVVFAVPHERAADVERAVVDGGYVVLRLGIGGIAIRAGDVRIDFEGRQEAATPAVRFEQAAARGPSRRLAPCRGTTPPVSLGSRPIGRRRDGLAILRAASRRPFLPTLFIDRSVDFGGLLTEAVQAASESESATTEDGRPLPVVPPEYIAVMKLATGDPRDERDVERLVVLDFVDYVVCRRIARRHLGPAAANRLDHIAERAGVVAASRYVRESIGTR